jgi:hypothetical protein
LVNNEVEIVFHCNDCSEVPHIEDAEETTEASFAEVQDEVMYIFFSFFLRNNIVWLGYYYRNFAW